MATKNSLTGSKNQRAANQTPAPVPLPTASGIKLTTFPQLFTNTQTNRNTGANAASNATSHLKGLTATTKEVVVAKNKKEKEKQQPKPTPSPTPFYGKMVILPPAQLANAASDKKGAWVDPKDRKDYSVNKQKVKPITPPPKPPSEPISPVPEPSLLEYSWNLPPHKWSLPVEPEVVNNLGGGHTDFGVRGLSNDMYRRGRLWWKANADVKISQKELKDGQSVTTEKQMALSGSGHMYGFQFLWNPETVGTSVAVQLEATPTAQDRFLGVAGAFPATETITFSIRLDRTNDFACAMAGMPRPRLEDSLANLSTFEYAFNAGVPIEQLYDIAWGSKISKERVAEFVKYYKNHSGFVNADYSIEDKLVDLFTRGTIADIEFLYRAINGRGPGGKKKWVNGRNIETADIGFLMPTLLHIDIGPLSYQGWVQNLSVNHIAFTKDMVPFRTDVSISCNVLATAGLTSSNAEK
jgi:hypothetical protein